MYLNQNTFCNIKRILNVIPSKSILGNIFRNIYQFGYIHISKYIQISNFTFLLFSLIYCYQLHFCSYKKNNKSA